MPIDFKTIDDFDLKDKRVLVRIDINSPVDPNSGLILDDTRMKVHSQTIKELSEKGAKIILLAHQSRPGKKDFTSLCHHADSLSKHLGFQIQFVDSIFSSEAIRKIKTLKSGEILLLENVRFFSEELLNRTVEEQSKTLIVRNLSPLIDIFVNDAFATAHRAQPSLIGFTKNIPSCAGRVMEKELKTILTALETAERPCVFVLGGVKADDSIDVIENVLKNKTADYILTTGLIGNIFLLASGVDIGEVNEKFIKDKEYFYLVDNAKKILKNHKDKIVLPEDLAVEVDGKRVDIDVNSIPNKYIYDIGIKTIKNYAKIIRKGKTIFANGPAGVFENPNFAIGTDDLLNAIATSNGFSIVGGGHIGAAAVVMGFDKEVNHISSGGGACISLLAGKKLVAVEALKNSK